ncbi:hypothetical protein THAPSDRAFT_34505 [Thalassiosira pseudonana CCMP1335]|uniref:Importin N-terminal domain-containing protein n=1 Tax=Thalassiosira pseudonana TaxID=35128 RepID=B8C1X0_THAPS|nr:hypothetical protein THAPSDRAFT_34505 [Thalassiosira pseudonana CCMP1335]EED92291.1 hypothetical protein THAPSDRAFT_34505 [Thalassiosira pseudonana CCMP1335]
MDDSQLAQVEALCETLYTGQSVASSNSDPITREEAQSRLLSLQSSANFIPQCQYILDRSQSQYALLVASNSLTELITTHWNNFTIAQRIDIRNYVLGYLANNGPTLQDFVTLSLIKLVCRITKLGWFDDSTHRELTEDVTKFLQATIDHCILGLKLLNQLVDELNIPTTGRTLTQHRKTSVSFRDLCLFKVFQLGLTTLQQLQSRAISDPQQEVIMGEQALSLTVRCLNFDFIGTNPDESTEDVGTIQAPSAWRPVLQDPGTTELLLDFYANTDPPRSSKAMEAVILLCSVRRSLFPSDKEREAFLGRVMAGIRELLKNQTGLQHQDNYHQFCRLLGRLKANYQLSELVKTEGYLEWLELAASFTTQSIRNWQYSTNSIHYLLALWGRLVSAVPYVRPDAGNKGHVQALQTHVLAVVDCYIEGMLGSVEAVLRSDGALEDPLEDDGSLMEQMDRLPTICRFQYNSVATIIIAKFDPLLTKYRELMGHLVSSSTESAPPNVAQQVAILEGQLTWLTYIIGAIVGGHSWSSSRVGDGDETLDASLSKRADSKLEVALLYYFQNFRRVYMFMWEQQKVYQNMFEHMGLGDHTVVANLIVTKIGKNLKFWPDEHDIISKTLELLTDMAGGYSSSKLLLTLDTVKYLASHHTHEEFPFLNVPSNARHRTTFHAILVRLLLSPNGDEKLGLNFDQFMESIVKVMTQLESLDLSQLRSEAARMPLVGVFRDLRGVAQSLHNRRTFGMLFDILEPRHMPLFSKVADLWYDQPDVIISLLRFMQEFCHNKANRVNFDQSSPNGILLFRSTSDVVCAFGRKILATPNPTAGDVYKMKYKGMSLALSVMNSALGGNYVCFGVFALYSDPALENALDICLKMALSIPLEQVIAYPKLSKSVFGFIEIMFRNHNKTTMALETGVFMQLMNAVHEGLQSSDAQISSMCANSIDHLATFFYENSGKDKPEVHNLNKHLAAQPNLFSSLTATLFNLLLFGAPQNHWAVMRPMLSLMLASESSFTAYKDHLMGTQDAANQALLNEAFNKLLADVSRSLESANRDRFTQKLTAFRVSTRGFLTL